MDYGGSIRESQGGEEVDWTFVLVGSFNSESVMKNTEETIRLRSGLHLKRGAMDNPDPCSQNAKLSATFMHQTKAEQAEQECGFWMPLQLHIVLAGSCTTPTQFTHTIDALKKTQAWHKNADNGYTASSVTLERLRPYRRGSPPW